MKDKQGESTSQPSNVILVVSTVVPSTLGVALAPNITTVTAEAITGTTTIGVVGVTQGNMANLSTEELIKSIEDLKRQVSELNTVKEQYANLEQRYDLSKISAAEKTREIKVLENKMKSLEKGLTFDKPLSEIKKILWNNIT